MWARKRRNEVCAHTPRPIPPTSVWRLSWVGAASKALRRRFTRDCVCQHVDAHHVHGQRVCMRGRKRLKASPLFGFAAVSRSDHCLALRSAEIEPRCCLYLDVPSSHGYTCQVHALHVGVGCGEPSCDGVSAPEMPRRWCTGDLASTTVFSAGERGLVRAT